MAAVCADYSVEAAELSHILAQWRRHGGSFPANVSGRVAGVEYSPRLSTSRSPEDQSVPVLGTFNGRDASVSGSPLTPSSSGTTTTSTAQVRVILELLPVQTGKM